MGKILVKNLRSHSEGIRCDRSSILGNPFLLSSESDRDRVCMAYRRYLHLVANTWEDPDAARQQVATRYRLKLADKWKRSQNQEFLKELTRIQEIIGNSDTVTLLCWCAPKACHCDILKRYFEWTLKF